MFELDQDITRVSKGALDLLLNKEDAPTIEDLNAQECDIVNRLLELNSDKVVEGGLSTGADIPLEYRTARGYVPPEIKSDKDLAIYKAKYEKLCNGNDAVRALVNDISSVTLQERANNLTKADLMLTAAISIPIAFMGAIGSIFGNDDKIFLISLLGVTIVVGAGVGRAAIRRASVRPANDNQKPSGAVFEYRKAQYRATRPQIGLRSQVLGAAAALCKKRKPFNNRSEPLMLAARINSRVKQMRGRQGPQL